MLALRVSYDARMNRQDAELADAQTYASRNPRLILCFSAIMNGACSSTPTQNQLISFIVIPVRL